MKTSRGVFKLLHCPSSCSDKNKSIRTRTWVVSAATSSWANFPSALKLMIAPAGDPFARERIGSQVTYLQLGVLLHKIRIGHPEQKERKNVCGWVFILKKKTKKTFFFFFYHNQMWKRRAKTFRLLVKICEVRDDVTDTVCWNKWRKERSQR